MKSPDRKSVLTIRSKQAMSNMGYWLNLIGYDIRDHSVSAYIYLAYLIIFFSAWILVVMFLLSDLLANTLAPFLAYRGVEFYDIVVIIGTALLGLWSLYLIYKYSLRSPLVFSNEDAYLLCQTPADRRFITITWLFGEWIQNIVLCVGIVGVIGFSFLELDVNNGLNTLTSGNLILSVTKPLGIILPLQLGLFTCSWIVGVYRLQGDKARIMLMRSIRALSIVLGMSLIVIIIGCVFVPDLFDPFLKSLTFISFPIVSAFTGKSWMIALSIALVVMTISLVLLWKISDKVNLSRAAQETHHFQAKQVAFRLGDFERINEMNDRKRLGFMHEATKIPSLSGDWILTWKNIVQSLRLITFSRFLSWINILLLIISLIIVGAILENSSFAILLIFYLTVSISKKTTSGLRKDLSNWWLLISLPLSSRRIILHNLIPPTFITIFIALISIWISNNLGLSISPIVLCSVPFVISGISISSGFDILRQSNSNALLDGRAPDIGLIGLLLGLMSFIIPVTIIFLSGKLSFPSAIGMFATILLGGFFVILLLRLSEKQFNRIG